MNAFVSKAQIAAVAEQIAPMCDGDEQLLQDMLEGETDLLSVVGRIHEQIARDTEMLEGIKARKAALAEREARIKHRAERFKEQVGVLLRVARLSKIELPEVTYSVREGKAKLAIVDAEAVPGEFCRIKHEPDKALINESFADTETLPNWLTWVPPHDVVTARAK
jgi:hypothetical protein